MPVLFSEKGKNISPIVYNIQEEVKGSPRWQESLHSLDDDAIQQLVKEDINLLESGYFVVANYP